jgi:phosphoribosyl 1,2-cyclic phosphodiesterase/CheY-like chemotaxis protein
LQHFGWLGLGPAKLEIEFFSFTVHILSLFRKPVVPDMKRVLLMDDDRTFLKVLRELFLSKGWEVFEAEDGERGLDLAREHRPEVIVCDLLMPRCNGFQVCRTIRAERQRFPNTKIIIISGSGYAADKSTALEAGADGYFTKPVNLKELLLALDGDIHLAHRTIPPPSATPPPKPMPPGETTVRFWGVRGSIPTPGRKTVYYGGNTACVEVRADGEIVVLDAGTGIRNLGLQLAEEFQDSPLNLTVLISHTHWDHIQGFPFFPPAYNQQNHIRVLSYESARKGLQATLESQMESPYFPITMQEMPGSIMIEELKDMDFSLGKVQVKAMFVNHPGVCAGYRLFTSAGSIAYVPDNELFQRWSATAQKGDAADEFAEKQDEHLTEFLRDVDVLIIDSQYDSTEYPEHVGWGHSCFEDSVQLAMRANVKKLLLFHHDPNHDDDKINEMLARAQAIAANSKVQVEAAREGLEIILKKSA